MDERINALRKIILVLDEQYQLRGRLFPTELVIELSLLHQEYDDLTNTSTKIKQSLDRLVQ